MTSSNEIGVSEEQSSRSLGSGDIGGNSGPDVDAIKTTSPINELMNSAPVLQGIEPMPMISSGGASA